MSIVEYFKAKMDIRNKEFNKIIEGGVLGKRSYKEAFGYNNDYEVVQEPSINYLHINKNINKNENNENNENNWIDAYTEQLFNK